MISSTFQQHTIHPGDELLLHLLELGIPNIDRCFYSNRLWNFCIHHVLANESLRSCAETLSSASGPSIAVPLAMYTPCHLIVRNNLDRSGVGFWCDCFVTALNLGFVAVYKDSAIPFLLGLLYWKMGSFCETPANWRRWRKKASFLLNAAQIHLK